MSYYECARCNYKVRRNSDMIRHLERKKKCIKNMDSYKMNDDEIYKVSLILHKSIINSNTEQYVNDIIENIIPNNTINDNIINDIKINDIKINDIKIDDITIDNIKIDDIKINENENNNKNTKNKDITCLFCSKKFTRNDNLKKHLAKYCKKNLDDKKVNNIFIDNKHIENKHIDNQHIKNNHIENTHIENKTNNIIIINPNNYNIQPFDNNWTTEHIDSYIRQVILLSDNKYTNLLDEILKNKDNLNVIIDKDSSYGLVYKNDTDLYVNMKVKEIIEKSIEKLYTQLNIFYSDLISNDVIKVNPKIIETEKQILDNKFENFCNDNTIKDVVSELLTNIYEKKQSEALNIAEKVINYSKIINNKIGY